LSGLLNKTAITVFILLALFLAHHPAASAPSQPAKKVLLLYSYQAVLPANVEWDTGIREGLEATEAEPMEFYTEYLDLAHHPTTQGNPISAAF